MTVALRMRLIGLTAMGLTATTAVLSDSDTDALIGQLSLGCKNRVLEQFGVPNSDITVRLGATVQDSLDSGQMTRDDLKAYGASFDWSVAGQDARGYCNVDGQGKVTEFQQW